MNKHERRVQSQQMAQEGLDWFTALFWAAILAALLLGAVAGHARVSVAHAQMPELRVEQFIPFAAREE